MHYLGLLLKLVCYATLAFVLAGIAALTFVVETGACPRLDEGAIECATPFYANLGYFGLGVLLTLVLTGLPALIGLVFLIRDFLHWGRARRA